VSDPSGPRHVLAVLDADAGIVEEAAGVASCSSARLTIVQTWRVPTLFWGLATFAAAPVSVETILREAEDAASTRVRRLVAALSE